MLRGNRPEILYFLVAATAQLQVLVSESAVPDPNGESIRRLTRRLAAGEEEAFREFHHAYFNRLFHFILVLTRGDETAAQDAVQETFCRVARYARRCQDEQVFWCWLTALARSAVCDGGRKRSRYWSMLRNYALSWLPLYREPQSESDVVLSELLRESLGDLEPSDRALLESKYCDGISLRELAAQSGLSERAVESKLLRLRRQLRDQTLLKVKKSQ
jgi:RNA polymerase sigma-70 factor (ECF subfamily)